ncbi:MAG: phosphatidylglycerophosphatase A [Candidatus Omnitrophica bacterium]|nr:phosphatidylglycerophosphatase A [Candidatus Omnitrophota bacterium]
MEEGPSSFRSHVRRAAAWTASVGGLGYVPGAPGTAACLVGAAIFWWCAGTPWFAGITLAVTALACAVSGPAERYWKEKDCKKIVIDDVAGVMITFVGIPATPEFLFFGFFLFRYMDILKIPPADILEKQQGAVGVVGDDIIAGIYTNLLLRLFLFLS